MSTTLSEARYVLRAFADLLAPPACAACDEPLEPAPWWREAGRAFCCRCEVGLAECDPAACATCGRAAGPTGCCRACQRRLAPLSSIRCGYVHEGPLAEAIHRFKYRSRDDLAAPLADLVASLPLPQGELTVVPVPLHPHRLAARGFDQAWLLARAIARRRSLRCRPRPLRRIRDTPAQVGQDRTARAANVRGAFVADAAVRGARVLLVDDVLTTGSTLREAARALVDAGVREVHALTLARPLP